ncbi:MAG: IS5 family transposase [Roseococcus sp.]|nr:IS5 family transposase [Roseococcus sp.]
MLAISTCFVAVAVMSSRSSGMMGSACRSTPSVWSADVFCGPRRRKGGTHRAGLGRSRGGFTSKLHIRGNAHGLPIALHVTAGQEADCSNYDALMEMRDSDPAIMLGDKGYDSDPIRQDLRDRGTVPEIPTKRNRHVQHSVSRPLYALRSRIECFINRLKNSRRVATRYDQTSDSFLGFAALSSIRLWIRFVHAT